MKFYFFRHGESIADIDDRFGGAFDDKLSLKGEEQAQELTQKLLGKDIEMLYVSPLIRTQETATILAEYLQCPIVTEPNLKERDQYGFLSGMIKSEAREKYPELVEKFKDRMFAMENTESYEDFSKRIQDIFKKITSEEARDCVGVVWHGGPMRVLFREILKKGEIKYGDCCFVCLEKNDKGEFTVVEKDGIEFLF